MLLSNKELEHLEAVTGVLLDADGRVVGPIPGEMPSRVMVESPEEVRILESLGYYVVTDSDLGAGGEV